MRETNSVVPGDSCHDTTTGGPSISIVAPLEVVQSSHYSSSSSLFSTSSGHETSNEAVVSPVGRNSSGCGFRLL